MRALIAAILVGCTCGVVSPAAQGQKVIYRGSDAVARFAVWFTAVREHSPGVVDAPLLRIASWAPPTLEDLFTELSVLRALMRNIRTSTFFVSRNDLHLPLPIRYEAKALNQMRDMATLAEEQGGTDIDFIERAAVLHTDLAFDPADLAVPSGDIDATGPSRTFIRFGDGATLSRGETSDHMRVARGLVALVPRGNTHDADIRRWYQATIAWQQHELFWDAAHTDAAVADFPNAPELLFIAGCLHEAAASPGMRLVVESVRLPYGARLLLGGERDELRKAASAFRHALDLIPGDVETRIHYGRVLTLLGEMETALIALRGTPDAATGNSLKYVASMFLGDAAEAAGHIEDARAAYTRAGSLFPSAQPPRLALSHLASDAGNGTAAREQLETMFTASLARDGDDDPLMTYSSSQARDAGTWLTDAEARFAQPGPALAR